MKHPAPIIEMSLLSGNCLRQIHCKDVDRMRTIVRILVSHVEADVERAWESLDGAPYNFFKNTTPREVGGYPRFELTTQSELILRWSEVDDVEHFHSAKAEKFELVAAAIERYSELGCLAVIALNDARDGRARGFEATVRAVENIARPALLKDWKDRKSMRVGFKDYCVEFYGAPDEKKKAVIAVYREMQARHKNIPFRSALYEKTSEELDRRGVSGVSVSTVKKIMQKHLRPKANPSNLGRS